ncbi:hypothetical protein N7488_003657 [Penicillium malachiteum]|nr:hypothetical protein N7488_003657 [Penicillium malachiteum]
MSRNDYLLTVALICQSYQQEDVNASADIELAVFNRYSLRRVPNPPDKSDYWTFTDVLLDKTKLAFGTPRINNHLSTERCYLELLPNTRRTIFTAQGMTDSETEQYELQVDIQSSPQFLFSSIYHHFPI